MHEVDRRQEGKSEMSLSLKGAERRNLQFNGSSDCLVEQHNNSLVGCLGVRAKSATTAAEAEKEITEQQTRLVCFSLSFA